AKRRFRSNPIFRLSAVTTSYATAKKWLAQSGAGSDGVIAKRIDLPYQSSNREGMQKIKRFRSADCVVGGFRYATNRIGGKKVVEVAYDHFSGERFRHGTSILRWRPDKAPRQCTFDQLKQTAADPMNLLG